MPPAGCARAPSSVSASVLTRTYLINVKRSERSISSGAKAQFLLAFDVGANAPTPKAPFMRWLLVVTALGCNAGQPGHVRSNLKIHAKEGGSNRESSCGDVSAGVRHREGGCSRRGRPYRQAARVFRRRPWAAHCEKRRGRAALHFGFTVARIAGVRCKGQTGSGDQ